MDPSNKAAGYNKDIFPQRRHQLTAGTKAIAWIPARENSNSMETSNSLDITNCKAAGYNKDITNNKDTSSSRDARKTRNSKVVCRGEKKSTVQFLDPE
jgi:hypothetical protein